MTVLRRSMLQRPMGKTHLETSAPNDQKGRASRWRRGFQRSSEKHGAWGKCAKILLTGKISYGVMRNHHYHRLALAGRDITFHTQATRRIRHRARASTPARTQSWQSLQALHRRLSARLERTRARTARIRGQNGIEIAGLRWAVECQPLAGIPQPISNQQSGNASIMPHPFRKYIIYTIGGLGSGSEANL